MAGPATGPLFLIVILILILILISPAVAARRGAGEALAGAFSQLFTRFRFRRFPGECPEEQTFCLVTINASIIGRMLLSDSILDKQSDDQAARKSEFEKARIEN